MIKREDIEKLSALARIPVSHEEGEALAGEIDRILAYVSEVGKVSGRERTFEMDDVYNVLRADGEPHESGMHTEALLKEAPSREGNYVKVKRILG